MKNHIVILGGMGPQASVALHSLLIHDNDIRFIQPDEYPFIIHASIPVTDFISEPTFAPAAAQMIEETCQAVQTHQAAVIGMACNTAHLLLEDIPSLGTPAFVSMIDAVVDDIAQKNIKKVGLLASPFTISERLYHDALDKRGVSVIQPTDAQIDQLGSIIRAVIAGDAPQAFRHELTAIAQSLQARGAECILLGCTELPLVGVDSDLIVIDSLSSLSKAMLRQYTQSSQIGAF